jgi:hypothetical protein
MNLNYLLKEEPQYEVPVRGIKSDRMVETLRKLFRSAIAEGVMVNLNALT